MRIDTLSRLVAAADVSSFRDLAVRYLHVSGYTEVELKDGPKDGGNDISLWQLGNNPEPIVIQISVQVSGWTGKVRSDAIRAARLYGQKRFVYLTSRRIPLTETQSITDELWSKNEITLRIIDGQAIASKFSTVGEISEVLGVLGITGLPSAQAPEGEARSPRADLAYAYAFFGTDVADFRETAIERSIAATITGSTDVALTREEVVDKVSRALRLNSETRVGLVSAQVDRMLQRGSVTLQDGFLNPSAKIADDFKAVRQVRGREWNDLREKIFGLLVGAGLGGQQLESAVDAALKASGALVLDSGAAAGRSVEPGADIMPVRSRINRKLNHLEDRLVNLGVSESHSGKTVAALAEAASSSEVGQTLLAGEVFLSLLSMEKRGLLNALGGDGDLDLFLDASVAIPMLASLLFDSNDDRFFREAHRAHAQAVKYGVRLFLPEVYLEEAASHLLNARSSYLPILDADPDLRRSKNAFVAHFVSLQHSGKYDEDFATYAASFGLVGAPGQQADPKYDREAVMHKMTTLFSRYGISLVSATKRPSGQALKHAQAAIAYTAKELNLVRSKRLLAHDAEAVAEISGRAVAGPNAVLFCTWDRLHLQLRTMGGAVEWNAMNPVMFADLLALASSEEDQAIGDATEIALSLSEADAQRGAAVWDELVRIEEADAFDASMLQRAQEFKVYFLERQDAGGPPQPLADAWADWKARHE